MNPPPEISVPLLPLTLAFLAVALLSGCGTAQYAFPDAEPAAAESVAGSTPVSAPATGPQAAAGFSTNQIADLLYPGYKLTVTFSGLPNPPPKHEEKIREDGYITPPLLGRPVMAAGKTVGQLQEELQKMYVPAFFTRALTVTVTTEALYFFVMGEVKLPGQKPYLSTMTALSAIQAAGGFTEYANKKKVQIIRVNRHTEVINCDKAIKNPKLDKPVYPGDQLIVPQRI